MYESYEDEFTVDERSLQELINEKRDLMKSFDKRGNRKNARYPEVTPEETEAIREEYDWFCWSRAGLYIHPVDPVKNDDDPDPDVGYPLCRDHSAVREFHRWTNSPEETIPEDYRPVCGMCGAVAAERGVIDRD